MRMRNERYMRLILKQHEQCNLTSLASCRVEMSLYRELAVSLILVSAAHLLPTTLSLLPISPPLDWGCPPCNRSSCPAASCDEDLQYVDACGCCVLCARLEGELCGGEGNTGGSCNGSGLFCAYRPGRIFGESRMGVCENGECARCTGACKNHPACRVYTI